MSATRIFMKLLNESGSEGTLSVTDGLSGVGPPPTLRYAPRKQVKREHQRETESAKASHMTLLKACANSDAALQSSLNVARE
jgi:hypothetical protein